jgi:anti-sigma factor RsiW
VTEHLSPRQITGYLLDEHSPEVEQHLEACSACRAEVACLGSSLTGFRDAVTGWSEAHDRRPATQHVRGTDSWLTLYGARWALLAVLLCVIVGLPLRRSLNHQSVSAVKITDAALLDQIDNELSRAAPHRMEPLLNLVSSDGSLAPDAP